MTVYHKPEEIVTLLVKNGKFVGARTPDGTNIPMILAVEIQEEANAPQTAKITLYTRIEEVNE